MFIQIASVGCLLSLADKVEVTWYSVLFKLLSLPSIVLTFTKWLSHKSRSSYIIPTPPHLQKRNRTIAHILLSCIPFIVVWQWWVETKVWFELKKSSVVFYDAVILNYVPCWIFLALYSSVKKFESYSAAMKILLDWVHNFSVSPHVVGVTSCYLFCKKKKQKKISKVCCMQYIYIFKSKYLE